MAAETYTVGPADGTLQILTGREGAAARMGHDLTLEATKWSATAVVDRAAPANSRLAVTVDARSIEVREGTGGALPLSDGQRGEIVRNIQDKVLHTDRHPTVTFTSTSVSGTVHKVTVDGTLSIGGVARPARLTLSAGGPGGRRIRGGTTVVQTLYGLRPYSAMLGALRVRDAVEIVVDVLLPIG